MRDIWVAYPSAIEAMERAMALVELPRGTYNPGMLVIGTSGAGKSTMVMKWVEKSWEPNSKWAGRLIYVDMSDDTNELNVQKRFIQELGKACNKPHLRTVAEAQRTIREFNIVGVVIDELGETEVPSMVRRWKLNLLSVRGLSNKRWGLNVILVGIEPFAKTVAGIPDLEARFARRRATLMPWEVGEELAAFIAGCMRYMPLMQESAVTADVFLDDLMQYSVSSSSGSTPVASLRSMLDLLKEACKNSILSGKEYVDETDLADTQEKLGGEKKSDVVRKKITLDD
jgi:hypothetical protein